MSEIQDWIVFLEKHTLDDDNCKELAVLLQERLDSAEKVYELNRKISCYITIGKRLEDNDLIALNFELGRIIKQLRGKE